MDFFPIQKIRVGTGTAYPYTTPCQKGSDAGMYFWDTALGSRRAVKMEKRGWKSCLKLRVTKWICVSQGKHRTWLKPGNNNQDVPHAQRSAALHPPWLGSRRRDEDTEAAPARFPPLKGCSQRGLAAGWARASSCTECALCRSQSLSDEHNIHGSAVITRHAFSAPFNSL